jgi:mannose-6-phosphate isomerase-like protein (cupin superfamily)
MSAANGVTTPGPTTPGPEPAAAPPMTRLARLDDPDELPAGMISHLYEMPGGDRPVAPVEMSHWSLAPGADSGDDQHQVREIWLIAAGSGVMTCGGTTIEVAAGDAVSIEPMRVHSLRNTGTGRIEVFSVWWAA